MRKVRFLFGTGTKGSLDICPLTSIGIGSPVLEQRIKHTLTLIETCDHAPKAKGTFSFQAEMLL